MRNAKCEMRNGVVKTNATFRASNFEFLSSLQQDLDTTARIGKKPVGLFTRIPAVR